MAVRGFYAMEFAAVAESDLLAIVEFIAAADSVAVRPVFDQIELRCAALKQLPGRGRIVPELAAFGIHTYRELVVAPWRIVYRVSGTTVLILAVVDGRRNMEDILLDWLIR